MTPADPQTLRASLANQALPQHEPLVIATRGDAVESIHYGSAVLLELSPFDLDRARIAKIGL